MKKIFFFLLFISSTIIFAQAKKDERGNLIGYATKSAFLDKQYKAWFELNYNNYKPDQEIVKKISKQLKDVSVLCFMGTWCGDSKRQTPKFYKIMEQAGFDFDKSFTLVGVDRYKKTPNNLQKGHNIFRVPTFIFFKRGNEIGRFVEVPRETMEKDILTIITGKPYKHSYEK